MFRSKMSLTLIFGPMFSGKSSYLLDMINSYSVLMENKALLIIPTSQRLFFARNRNMIESKNLDVIACDNFTDLKHIINEHIPLVCIDEAQFMSGDIASLVDHLISKNSNIYISSLSGDYQMKQFGQVYSLIPKADDIIFMKAWCADCMRDGKFTKAPFTKRIVNIADQILVGDVDFYKPVCRGHST